MLLVLFPIHFSISTVPYNLFQEYNSQQYPAATSHVFPEEVRFYQLLWNAEVRHNFRTNTSRRQV